MFFKCDLVYTFFHLTARDRLELSSDKGLLYEEKLLKSSKNQLTNGKGQIKIKLKYTLHDSKFIIMILFARNLV